MRSKQPRKISLLLLAFALLVLFLPASRADVLLPGGTDTSVSSATTLSGLTLLGQKSGTATVDIYNVSVTDAVYKTGSGTLDFLIQVAFNSVVPTDVSAETITPTAYLTGLSNADFTGFNTNVGYLTDGSSLPGSIFVNGTGVPDSVERSSNGSLVGFVFEELGSDITPGTTTDVLVIATNATQYDDNGTLGLSFAAPDPSAGGAFEPTPEPSSLLLLSSGLVGLGFMKRKVFQS
jgi:hypothetical protein